MGLCNHAWLNVYSVDFNAQNRFCLLGVMVRICSAPIVALLESVALLDYVWPFGSRCVTVGMGFKILILLAAFR